MHFKHWVWFTVIQLVVVNMLTIPWFFREFPDDWTILMGRYAYFLFGWGVIVVGVYFSILTWQEERWKEPTPNSDLYAWMPIPGFPDYEVDGYGQVWDVEQGNIVKPRWAGGFDYYDLYTPDGTHKIKERKGLVIEAQLSLTKQPNGRHLNK